MKTTRRVIRRILIVLGLMSIAGLIVQLVVTPESITWPAYIFWIIVTILAIIFENKDKSTSGKDLKNT
jgi:peptidoglycan/LPS O-acetylase OafA/YrhL